MVVRASDIRLVKDNITFRVSFKNYKEYNCITNRYTMRTQIKGKAPMKPLSMYSPEEEKERFCCLKVGQSLATLLKNTGRLISSKDFDISYQGKSARN